LFGQARQSIGLPDLLRLDARHSELHLDEAEPDGRFLLIVGAKLDLRDCCRRDGLTIVRVRYTVLCEKTKEGAAQTTAGKCSEEEARNMEATMRAQQKETNGSQEQNRQK
jgi:hypothetical protein